MPVTRPLLSSGARLPEKPRPLPAKVRKMIHLLVRGDGEAGPISLLDAGRAVGLRPERAREWSDRPDFLVALRAARKAFRREIAASDEFVLKDLRDNAQNGMVRLGAVRMIEEMNADETARPPSDEGPRFSITLVSRSSEPPVTVIEGRTTIPPRYIAPEPEEPEPPRDPIFTPRRWP